MVQGDKKVVGRIGTAADRISRRRQGRLVHLAIRPATSDRHVRRCRSHRRLVQTEAGSPLVMLQVAAVMSFADATNVPVTDRRDHSGGRQCCPKLALRGRQD